MYEVTAVVGYEYHDDYVETGTREIKVGGGDVYNMATAERVALTRLLATCGDDGWVRIEKIELVK